MTSGRTKPLLAFANNQAGSEIEVVLKIRGPEISNVEFLCEAIAGLLAKDLSLPVPDFFSAEVAQDMVDATQDSEAKARLQNAVGLNFASAKMSGGYTGWISGQKLPDAAIQPAADILFFDFLTQNPDRTSRRANLLSRGAEFVMFDHDKAFSFIYPIIGWKPPWEGGGMDILTNHVFYSCLKGKHFGFDRIKDVFGAFDRNHFKTYVAMLPEAWTETAATEKVVDYLSDTAKNIQIVVKNALMGLA